MNDSFTLEQLKSMRLMPNKVMVKLDRSSYQLTIVGGIVLEVAWTFSPELYTPIKGEVVNVCDRLRFSLNEDKFPEPGSMGWETPLQVHTGDTVIMNWFLVMGAIGRKADPANKQSMPADEQRFMVGEDMYIIVDYQALIFAIRELPVGMEDQIKTFEMVAPGYIDRGNYYRTKENIKEIVPLNGYIIVAPEYEDVASRLIQVSELSKKKSLLNYGRVIWSGRCNEDYAGIRGYFDDPRVKNGQLIAFEKLAMLRICNNSRFEFFDMLYMQRHQVCAIIEDAKEISPNQSVFVDD